MKIIKKKLADLKKPERNVRLHTDKQLHEFRRSIEMFDQIRPIVIDEDNVILAGNGLYEALSSLGRTEADCYIVSGLTESGKKKLMLADNRVFDLGVDDLATFDAFILELKDDLDIPGFEEDLLKSIVMEADEAGIALQEYGTIDESRKNDIKETRDKYEAQEEAAAQTAEQYVPPSEPAEEKRKYILCQKCGERIWL
ncbi:MAG: putative transcriptional regulator [Eubacterium sp.]|jgi:ParB-like chromosome segregation protein Spo0J|nr:putative transcriptional regulator [Eubacterium sp.]